MDEKLKKLTTKVLSSLSKVFPDKAPEDENLRKVSVLLNEAYSFQIAYRLESTRALGLIRVCVDSYLSKLITLRIVGLVPSELPSYPDHDDHILRGVPGLFPDPLYPYKESEGMLIAPNQWRSIWVTVELDGMVKPGIYPISIRFETENGDVLDEKTIDLEVISAKLPKQKLIHTEWFHADCIANYYKFEVFSEEHWKMIELFVGTAVRHGINMLLTPIFTPPLDTKIGGERLTTQLVEVQKEGANYTFCFKLLKRWIEMCERQGIQYIEISHLFTQWGAKHAPKIIAIENANPKQIFGWDTDATGEEYKQFLGCFLPQLVKFIIENGIEDRVYFHVSDEPHLEHLYWYKSASEILQKYLSGFPIIDAISNAEFYDLGLVRTPIPSNDMIIPFLERDVPHLWTYYCCGQYKKVSNRFFDMPSVRNRIFGIQLYKYNITGFLHWGYNFWNSYLSTKEINAFQVTDADLAFPSGDAFLVYPGVDGPIESIRLEVLFEALQDVRALQLLESLIGKTEVIKLIEQDLEQEITFDSYPMDKNWLLGLREKINLKIQGACNY